MLKEWTVTPSVRSVKAGHVHVAPRHSGFLTLTLRPGRYVLFCDIPGHYEAGQHAGFRVR